MSAFDSIRNSFRRWQGPEDEVEDVQEIGMHTIETDRITPSQPKPVQSSSSGKVFTYNASTTLRLVVNKPKKYSDAAEIADLYKNKTTVIIMFKDTNKDLANRIIDFIGGVSYATGGNIKRISDTTYVLAPYNVDISGDFIEEINNISGEDLFEDLD